MAKKNSSAVLVNYWRGLKKSQKDQLAEVLGTSPGYLRQVFLYGKQVGAIMARDLSQHTGLGASEFRRDIFGDQAA
ncbi:Chorismate lyase [Amphritea atlantica]|uniref:Chorismate lyase n=1 Tax=Amphritea atlantica TaxID=355243 RepID=A0A1H9GEX1_9GAMM|nr:chorismate lyase [Amphritea atlantica]SEQ48583.1 Chorismate lyase [Amphritea atlantica]